MAISINRLGRREVRFIDRNPVAGTYSGCRGPFSRSSPPSAMRRCARMPCATGRRRDGRADGGLGLGVAEDASHHRQALAAHHHLRRERVPEVVNAHVLQPRSPAHPPSWLLQVRQMCALAGQRPATLNYPREPRLGARQATLRQLALNRSLEGLGFRSIGR